MSKIVIGAAGTNYPGWISTNRDTLDLLNPDDWAKYAPVEMALAEHVWEHLTPEQGRQAARNVYAYVPRIRVAVPDGLYPDLAWVEKARYGDFEGDHNTLYNYATLATVFREAGYIVTLREWWDERGVFHYYPWNPEDGMVMRSLRYDRRNRDGRIGYTSVIVDAWRGQ